MKRLLPDLRNARAGIEPKRIPRADSAVKPVGCRFVNDANDPTTTELWLYDEIGMWGIAASDVIDQLMQVTTPNLRVRINSPGGDVFDGIAIMNALASYNGTVTGVVDSLCASIATAIAMACETLTMSPGSQMMIHQASGVCFGDADDMTQMASVLAFQTSNIAGLYAARAGGDQGDWLKLMQAETWMTADEAVTRGLADVTGVVKQSGTAVVPSAPDPWGMWDLSVYKHAAHAQAPAPHSHVPDLFARHIRVDDQGHRHVIPAARNDTGPALDVQWEWSTGGTNPCDECQFLADSGPYNDGDQPEPPPLHPNCDCTLTTVVDWGMDSAAGTPITSTANPVADELDAELFRSMIRKALV